MDLIFNRFQILLGEVMMSRRGKIFDIFKNLQRQRKYKLRLASHIFQSDFIKISGKKNVGADLRNYVCNFRNLLKTVMHSLFDATERQSGRERERDIAQCV